jgi:hypothetical protein
MVLSTPNNNIAMMNHMKAIKFFRFVPVLILATSLAGCATSVYTGKADVDKTAFGPKKRFAVVSIASVKYFQGEKGFFQMFKSNDKIAGANTEGMLNKLVPTILRTLNHSHYIRLVSERRVLRNPTYRRLAEDKRSMRAFLFHYDLNTARHFKYFSDPKKFAKLAKALHVNGVISITMTFTVLTNKSGFNINGIGFGKKTYSSSATITAVAYDRNGKVIWKDSTIKKAKPGDKKYDVILDTSDFRATDFKKFRPSAIKIGAKAVDVLVSRLDDSMAGKEVSSMQRM